MKNIDPNNLLNTVNGRVRLARTNAQMSLKDLAWRTRTTWYQIDAIESGTETPDENVLKAIAEHTHVSVEWLKTGKLPDDESDMTLEEKLNAAKLTYNLNDILTNLSYYAGNSEESLRPILNFVAGLTGITTTELRKLL